MSKIKVMSVFGTRPEAIKMCPLVKELQRRDEIQSHVCVTAQHREMLDQMLQAFSVTPDFDLDIMEKGQTLAGITAKALPGLERVFQQVQPDIVLVHGDTTTTFVAALAAFYTKSRVGHVEAGLRSFDKYSPYPEEMNRCLISRLADLHFAPTPSNRANLEREATAGRIFVTGNTVIDALQTTVQAGYQFRDPMLAQIDLDAGRVILVTAHRRENWGEPLRRICRAIRRIVEENPDVQVVYPVHLNPAIRSVAEEELGGVGRIHLIAPLDVFDMHNLMARCYLVMTDSGGLQEEAPALGKPVLVLRTETERPEAVEYGTVKMAGIEEEQIRSMANELLRDPVVYNRMAQAVNPYGDGRAAERIVGAILYHFGRGEQPREFQV